MELSVSKRLKKKLKDGIKICKKPKF